MVLDGQIFSKRGGDTHEYVLVKKGKRKESQSMPVMGEKSLPAIMQVTIKMSASLFLS